MANSKALVGEVISPADVVKSRRGRKANVNVELRDFLASLEVGQIARIKTFGPVEKTDKAERGKVGAVIRNHWKMISDETPSIAWDDATNLPQVGRKSDMTK